MEITFELLQPLFYLVELLEGLILFGASLEVYLVLHKFFGGVELLRLKLHHQSACLKHKEVCCEFILTLVCFYPCLRCLLKYMHSVCSKRAEIARSEFEGEV